MASVRTPSRLRNYLGQLRLYSFVDLVLMLTALGASFDEFVGIALLWFGFLVYLEWRHQDRGRLHWPWSVWAALWISGMAVTASPLAVPFVAFSMLYAEKKRIGRWGAASWLANGALKATLAVIVSGTSWSMVVFVGALMAVRNLAGDVRDARKDAEEGFWSLPVLLGYQRDGIDPYPAALMATSIIWTLVGGLPWWSLAAAILVQVATYRLTPR